MEETFKLLTGCENDTLTKHFINKAIQAITRYVNNPTIDIDDTFQLAIIELARYYYTNRNSIGVSSMSQGNRSVTFNNGNHDIPNEIKAMLPHYVTVV